MPVIAKLYTIDGKALSIHDWAELYGMDDALIRARLRGGVDIKEAVREVREQKTKPRPRKLARLRGDKIYEGAVHKKCGSRFKYTGNGSCMYCGT